MTNKEVGEAWLWLITKEPDPELDPHTLSSKEGIALIHKLVEERALTWEMKGWRKSETMRMARRDFGIPEETWK